MNRNIKITLLLCFSLVLMFGSAMADMGNNSTQDTPSADTPSNNSVNGTDDVDDDAADGNETDDAAADGNETDDAVDGNETDDAVDGNETDDAVDGNETNDAADGNETDDAADDNVADELTDELFSEGEEVDDETDDIPPFEGAVGPEHALYGLKIAFGNINETFTYNSSERLGLQVSRARHRIAEARAEIKNGNDKAAGVALGHYKKMMDNIGDNVNGSDINSTDLVKANEKMSKHQNTLQYMVLQKNAQGKDVEGLTDALNNNLMLQDKFSNKLEKKLQKGDAGHGSMKEQLDKPVNTLKDQKDQKESNNKNIG